MRDVSLMDEVLRVSFSNLANVGEESMKLRQSSFMGTVILR